MDDLYEDIPDEWNPKDVDLREGVVLGLIVFADQSLFEDDEGMPAEALFAEVAAELRPLAGARNVQAFPVDPFVGAGGTALQVALEYAGYAADLITVGLFLKALKPKLVAATARLQSRFATGGRTPKIVFSGTALQVLVVADLCENEQLDPTSFDKVECIMHSARPAEPCPWLRPTDAAYTITVTQWREDGFYHLWSYLVTCFADVISVTHFTIPRANASHWYQVKEQIIRPLRGMNEPSR